MVIALSPTPNFQRLEESFEYAARHYPARTAVRYLDAGLYKSISYGQLNLSVQCLANIFASQLGCSTHDTTPFVGLFLARNLNQVVATLATLAAGAAFVPIALDSNAVRFGAILSEAKIGVIITDFDQHDCLRSLLERVGRPDIMVLDASKPYKIKSNLAPNHLRLRDTSSPAYVLFSSGTTGTPKGIVISHLAALTYCRGANEIYKATCEDAWVRGAAYTFDSSIDELFCPLVAEATIIIQPNGALSSFSSYLGFLKASSCTILTLTTALWHQLTSYLVHEGFNLPPSIRILSIGGEAALGKVFKMWRQRFGDYPQLLNGYGPTEASVCTTYWEAHDNIDVPVLPIGRPIRDYHCHLLDPVTHSPVGMGHEGMLYVSGPALAIGYLNDPAQTESKFVPNPWAESPTHSRMYCTGDLARMDSDGILHFSGRADLQVKIRGFRVELESVEACLLSFPGVKEVGVAVHKDSRAQSQSVHAYLVMGSSQTDIYADDIVAHCAQTLASYEVPACFYNVTALLYTRSRKLDRRALQGIGSQENLVPTRSQFVNGGAGNMNSELARLWSECLDGINLELLSAPSHFLHLGGHSLTLIMLAAKIFSVMGVEVSSVDLLQNPTLGQMSKFLESRGEGLISNNRLDSVDHAATNHHDLDLPRKPCVQRWTGNQDQWDISDQNLYTALKETIHRHSILRVKLFQDDTAQVLQEIVPFDDDFFEAVFCHERLGHKAAARRAHEIFVRPFRLFEDPLVRIALLSSDVEHILVVCAHHIIWDGFSDRVFLNELVSLYQGKGLPPASSYFAHCYRSQAQPEPDRLSALVSYLDSVPQILELPIDCVRPDSQTFSHGRNVHFNVNRHAVSQLVNRLGTSPYACLMTAFAAALHLNAAGQEGFMIGVPFANRLNSSEANAIGFFINMLPLRVRFGAVSSLDNLHAIIRADLLFLSGLQDVLLDSVVDSLGFNRLSSRDSLLQAVLNFTDAPEGELSDRAKFARHPLNNGAAHTDMVCFVELSKDGSLAGEIEYNSDIFTHESMDSFASAFTHILDTWSAQPTQSIREIIFPQSSAHIPLLRELSPEDRSFGGFLISSATRHWDRQAVYDDNTGTDQLSSFRCVDGAVVLLLERNVDTVAVEIGVCLSGLVFAPCDVTQPRFRTEEIIANCNPVCVLAHQAVANRLGISEDDFSVPLLLVDGLQNNLALLSDPNALVAENGGEAAYIIHTSGSTEKPKGIVIGQGSLVKLVQEVTNWAGSSVALNCVTTSNLAWDGVFAQIWPSLATGGCVKLPKLHGEKDGQYLSGLMRQVPVTNSLAATPSAYQMWLDQTQECPNSLFPDGMRHLMVGGEQFTPEFALRLLSATGGSPNIHIINIYGPTEGTIPVETLVPSAAMTIVSSSGHELPRGFVGEIVIWGPCLMLEYLNMPDLNKQKALMKDGVRGWRSGDMDRHLPSGGFEIFRRMDSMQKVKGGFRVDLGEIETHIRMYTPVVECCVLVQAPAESLQPSPNRIVAFVKLEDEPELQMTTKPQGRKGIETVMPERMLAGLHRHLSHRIPAYMVPTTSSKLPKPSLAHRFVVTSDKGAEWSAEEESRRETTESILDIFATVLSVGRKLTHKDSFYECGGHSLLATRVTSLIRRKLGVPLPFTAIITHPTASNLAEFVETLKLQSARSLELPPHIIPLQPAGFIRKPKAVLFAFHFIGGDLNMLPHYKLNSLEKMSKAYAESIAQVAGSTPCILVGWCFGAMIACKASLYLPEATTHLIIFDTIHISMIGNFHMDEADFAKAFGEYLCKVWFGPGLQSAELSGEKAVVIQAVLDAKIDWHDIPSLVALARRHVILPPWLTDADLALRIRPLADSHDLMIGVYQGGCCTPDEAAAIEEKVIVNLQATDGLNVTFDTAPGLGWARYEIIDTDHDTIGYLPIASTRMLSALKKLLGQ
ncbi:hypothetical protein FRC12_012157 [Ceratobasidium sp. 428]|nr:hypothetical protein FRC12_012157 [Ceratobasidium sp. 428]